MNEPIVKTRIPNIKHIITVASGKGGVGKSTVAAGIALALSTQGFSTGLLDADIHGPSVPVLFHMQGAHPSIETHNGKDYISPFVRYGVKLMSIGFFVDSQQAIIWRGPRVSSGLSQLLTETYWGELDYLIVDTPPGTGDVHITLMQNFELSGVVVVTTPQKMALSDVKKAIQMYQDSKIGVPVTGIVENMSWFSPSIHPEEKYYLFGKGGGSTLAEEFHVPILAQIPINESMCEICDSGRMDELFNDKNIEQAFMNLSQKIMKTSHD